MAEQTKATAAEAGNRKEGGESEKKTYPASRAAIIEPEADIDADQMPSGDRCRWAEMIRWWQLSKRP